MFPFDTSKASFGGGLADFLKIGAGCVRCEVGSHGAWVCVEPFLHVNLELVFGMLVLEDVGYFPGAQVIRRGGSAYWLKRASGDAEGVPE